MAKRILNVLTQSDENYILPGGVMITSLCENNRHFDEINIYYLSLGLSKKSVENLKKLEKQYSNLSISIIDSEKYRLVAEDLNLSKWNGKQITWFKLLALSDIKISTDRILFLNPHSLIVSNLDYLVELEFSDKIMLNIYDYFENFPGFRDSIGDPYYNCGLMLINHKAWLQEGMGKKVRDSLKSKSDYKIADQDFCNKFFNKRIGALPFEYYAWEMLLYYSNKKIPLKLNRLYGAPNYYSYENILCGAIAPKIIYLTSVGTGRAWYSDNEAPSKHLFERYMAMSPFKNTPRPKTKHNLAYFICIYFPKNVVALINFTYSFINLNLLWNLKK